MKVKAYKPKVPTPNKENDKFDRTLGRDHQKHVRKTNTIAVDLEYTEVAQPSQRARVQLSLVTGEEI